MNNNNNNWHWFVITVLALTICCMATYQYDTNKKIQLQRRQMDTIVDQIFLHRLRLHALEKSLIDTNDPNAWYDTWEGNDTLSYYRISP